MRNCIILGQGYCQAALQGIGSFLSTAEGISTQGMGILLPAVAVGAQKPSGSRRCHWKNSFFSVSSFSVFVLTQLLFPFVIPCNYSPVSPQFPSFSPSSQGGNSSSAKEREHPAPRKKALEVQWPKGEADFLD